MSLNKSLRAGTAANIRLPQLYSIPNTEDLRFLLATAKKVKKCAEITFQNPSNGFFFLIKVLPPANQAGPRWTLERVQGMQNLMLWTRESDEVMTIQNKVKMDCIYSAGVETDSQSVEAAVDEIVEAKSPIVLKTTKLSYNALPAQEAVESDFASFQSQAASSNQPAKEYGGWMPVECAVELPSPVYFPLLAAEKLMQALCHQQTGMIRYSALIFLLMREAEYRKKNKTSFSLLVFDFTDQADKQIQLTVDEIIHLNAKISAISSPIDVFSQLQTGEFILVSSGANAADALKTAENIYHELSSDAILMNEEKHKASLCIGVASISETCEDVATLIAAALKAKKIAKETSKNTMLFGDLKR